MSGSDSNNDSKANAMWGGRFAAGPDAVMSEINASIGFDKRLYAQDIAGSKAHCRMLVQQGIVTRADGDSILSGLMPFWMKLKAGASNSRPRWKTST